MDLERGINLPSSDFDIVVVVDDSDLLDVVESVSLLRKEGIPLDIVILHSDELDDPIYMEMLKYMKNYVNY